MNKIYCFKGEKKTDEKFKSEGATERCNVKKMFKSLSKTLYEISTSE